MKQRVKSRTVKWCLDQRDLKQMRASLCLFYIFIDLTSHFRFYFNLHQLISDPHIWCVSFQATVLMMTRYLPRSRKLKALVPGTMPPHPMKVRPLHIIPYRNFTIPTFSDNDSESEDGHDYSQKGKTKRHSQTARDSESSYHFNSSTLFLRHAETLRVLYAFLTTH